MGLVVREHSYADDVPARPDHVNANETVLYTVINGNLDWDNITAALVNAANGFLKLDANGLVPAARIPANAEVVAARGSMADLDERLDVALEEDGTIGEVVAARGSMTDLDERLDVELNENGTSKAKGSKASLDARLDVRLNEDGTLKSGLGYAGRDKKNLVVKVNAANPTYQIDVDVDVLQVDEYSISSINLTVDITASGINGLDTGSEAADTWYSVWVIYNPATDTTAGLLSTSTASPTMPSGYTKKRRVGWVKNDGSSNFLKFYQIGDWWWWDVEYNVLDVDPSADVWTDIDCSAYRPPTSELLVLKVRFRDDALGETLIYLRRKGSSQAGYGLQIKAGGASTVTLAVGGILMSCDSNGFIQYYTPATGDVAEIGVLEYYDPI